MWGQEMFGRRLIFPEGVVLPDFRCRSLLPVWGMGRYTRTVGKGGRVRRYTWTVDKGGRVSPWPAKMVCRR